MLHSVSQNKFYRSKLVGYRKIGTINSYSSEDVSVIKYDYTVLLICRPKTNCF